ncbi:MAG: alpha/beta hydrolase [Pseudomonadota bacterium]|nr:alpha/beta hydrolase [Pseudomonadota bacterium]
MVKSSLITGALAVAALSLAACGPARLTADQTCQAAVYRLADGRLLDIAPADGPDLRWRLNDGRTGRLSAKAHWSSTLGWTDTPDGVSVRLSACGARRMIFTDKGAAPVAGLRVPLIAREATFLGSGGVRLHGRLVLPPGAAKIPVVVEVHGSEKDAATVYNFLQRLYPAQGVGVFVYDKRGTGESGGKYTQDFQVLARDAAAAVVEARALAGGRLARIGFQGTSQGGWVAPLAATLTPVDFVIVDFGLAGSVAEENTDETVLEVARKGYRGDDLEGVAETARATNAIVASRFRGGYAQLDAARAKYRTRPWFRGLNGQFTGQVLKYPDWVLKVVGPAFDMGTPIYYDPRAVLAKVPAPMLWVLADDDTLAPNAETRRRLAWLIANGRPITVLGFPATDHGILEFITAPDGTRTETRYADGYFQTMIDWAKTGRLQPPYGRSEVVSVPRAASLASTLPRPLASAVTTPRRVRTS